MKTIIPVIAAATFMLSSPVVHAAKGVESNVYSKLLVSSEEIHIAISESLQDSIEELVSSQLTFDPSAVIANARIKSELDNYLFEAKSDLPKNRFRVVFAD